MGCFGRSEATLVMSLIRCFEALSRGTTSKFATKFQIGEINGGILEHHCVLLFDNVCGGTQPGKEASALALCLCHDCEDKDNAHTCCRKNKIKRQPKMLLITLGTAVF